MKATTKKLENAVTEIQVTFDKEEWTVAKEEATKKLAKNVKVDGFRPGKAPISLIKSKISKASILEEATEIILQKQYVEILKSENVEPVGQPQLSVEKVDEDGLSVKILAPTKPEVELGTYKGLEVTKEKVSVAKEDIQARLDNYQQQFAELSLKEDGAVENGDTAVIDFEGFIDDVAFEGGKGENHPLEIGSNSFIPGFEEQIIGMKVSEEKDITVIFPDEYQAELAGKEAVFKVKVHEIKAKALPEFDDELAKDVNIDGVETLEQLEDHIKSQLKAQKEIEVENKYDEDLFKAIIDGSKVDESEALVLEECNIMLQEIEQNLKNQGMTFELYEQFTGKDKQAIVEDIKPQASDRVKLNLVLGAIIKEEKLEVTSEEIDKELEEIATYYQKELAEVKQIFESNMERIETDLLTRKALELVKENLKK